MNNHLRRSLAVVCSFLFAAFSSIAATNHWTGAAGDGLWSTGANWSSGASPTLNDAVVIDASGTYSITVDTSAQMWSLNAGATSGVQTLQVSGRSISVATTATVLSNAVLNLDNGSLRGSNFVINGSLNWSTGMVYTASLTVGSAGKLSFLSDGEKDLYATLQNYGVMTWNSGGRLITTDSNAVYNIGTFILQTNLNLQSLDVGGTVVFPPLINSGQFRVPANTRCLLTSLWMTTNSGSFYAETNAVLDINGNIFFTEGSSIDGPGIVQTSIGVLRTQGTIHVNGTFELTGGIIRGTSTWAGPGQFVWAAGRFDSDFSIADTTTFAPDLHVSVIGNGAKTIIIHNLLNQGTIIYDATSGISGDGFGGIITNAATLILESDLNLIRGACLYNSGRIQVPANTVASLDIDYEPNFTSTGSLYADTNAVLNLGGNTGMWGALNDGCSIDGPGIVQASLGVLKTQGAIHVNGTFELTGAIIQGTSTWEGPGQFVWAAGQFDSDFSTADTTTFAPDLHVTIIGDGPKTVINHTVENQGTIVCADVSTISGGYYNGFLNNGGIIILQNDLNLTEALELDNSGRIQVPANTVASVTAPLFDATFASTGSLYADTNAVLSIGVNGNGSGVLGNGCSIDGPGSVQASARALKTQGTIHVNGNFKLAGSFIQGTSTWTGPGQFYWDNGWFMDYDTPGTTTLAADLHVAFSGAGGKAISNHTVNNQGTVVCNDGTTIAGGYMGGVFSNAGNIVLQGNLTFMSGATLYSSGQIRVPQNTLSSLNAESYISTFTITGSLYADTNALLDIGGFTSTSGVIGDGCSIDGPGLVQATSATLTTEGTIHINSTFKLAGAGILGTSTWMGPGQLDWTNAWFHDSTAAGTTTFAPNLHVAFDGGPWNGIENHTIINEATMVCAAGSRIGGEYNSVINNNGTLIMNGDFSLLGTGNFTNLGRLEASTNTQASFTVDSGWPSVNSGTFYANSNAVLNISGSFTYADGSTIDGPGVVNHTGGTLEVDGTQVVNGTFQVTGPDMYGDPTWTGTGQFNWLGGIITSWTDGPITIETNLHFNISGTGYKTLHACTLSNYGIITCTADVLNGDYGRIANAGTFILATNTTFSMDWQSYFTNSANGVLQNKAGTNFLNWEFDNSGTIVVGGGMLQLVGAYTPPQTTTHQFVISNYNNGIFTAPEFDANGTLSVVLTNHFVPTNESAFTIINAGTLSGTFSQLQLQPISSNLVWSVEYTSTSVILHVKQVPILLTQPVSRKVDQGTNVTFSASASGSEPLMLQWYSNNVAIAGATNSIYEITNVKPSQAASYSITASNDFGVVTSTNAVLTVVADTKAPSILVSSPVNNLRTNTGSIVVSGVASDNVRVTQVLYNLNRTGFQPVTLTNGGKTVYWSTPIPLLVGTNTLVAKCIDMAGNESLPTTTRTFIYAVSNTLTLITNGTGSINGITNGQFLQVSNGYKITAVPGSNNVFSNWTGSVTSTNAVLTFIMQSNMVLQANFIPNPFIRAAGTYHGLFYETNGVTHQSSGSFSLTLLTNFSYSGKLQLDGDTIGFAGKFALNGTTTIPVSRVNFGKSPLTISLNLDFSNYNDQVTGTISGSNWTAQVLADRYIWANQPATNFSGTYTFLIPGFTNANDGPIDYGYGSVTIGTNGNATWNGGGLADGMLLNGLLPISKNGTWPVYVPLYIEREGVLVNNIWRTNGTYKGSLLGWIDFTNSTPTGTLSWIKTGWTNVAYANGFTNQSVVLGSAYTAPNTGSRLLQLTNGTITISGGDLSASLVRPLVLSSNNVATITPTNNYVRLGFVPKTGIFSGSFRDPALPTRTILFKGVVVQRQNFGGGSFLDADRSGEVKITTP